jgi:hypothetical protein
MAATASRRVPAPRVLAGTENWHSALIEFIIMKAAARGVPPSTNTLLNRSAPQRPETALATVAALGKAALQFLEEARKVKAARPVSGWRKAWAARSPPSCPLSPGVIL